MLWIDACYRVCSMAGWKDEAKWLKAARELNFSPEQRKRVLSARDDALGTLHQCVSCKSQCFSTCTSLVVSEGCAIKQARQARAVVVPRLGRLPRCASVCTF